MSPSVTAVVPWRPGDPDREAAWRWTRARLESTFPAWRIVEADYPGDPYSKASAVMSAVRDVDSDLVVIHDADVWVQELPDVVAQIRPYHDWLIPHYHVRRLNRDATRVVLEGGPIDMRRTVERHRACVGGALVIIRREILERVPFDPRFRGWGGEDISFGYAMETLVGPPMRYPFRLAHLWHEPQPRRSRTQGSEETEALFDRYKAAYRNPDAMAALVDEARAEVRRLL